MTGKPKKFKKVPPRPVEGRGGRERKQTAVSRASIRPPAIHY